MELAELYASLDKRWRPESVAAVIKPVIGDLNREEHQILNNVAKHCPQRRSSIPTISLWQDSPAPRTPSPQTGNQYAKTVPQRNEDTANSSKPQPQR